jgi:hypothetical protein
MSFAFSRKSKTYNTSSRGAGQHTDCPSAMYDVQEYNGVEYIAEEIDGGLQWVPNDYKDKVKTKIFKGFFAKRR